jgi:hypothetical protein
MKVLSSLSHWKSNCSRHDIAETYLVGVKQQSLTHRRALSPSFVCNIIVFIIWFSMRQWRGPLSTRPTRLVGFFFSSSSLKQQSAHYPDPEPTSLCSFSLMMRSYRRSNKYQFYSLCFAPIRARTQISNLMRETDNPPQIYAHSKTGWNHHLATMSVV